MAGRFSRSWQIFKSSASVLRENKKLLIFPLLSSIAALIVMASFGVTYLYLGHGAETDSSTDTAAIDVLYLFAMYLVLYSITIFFNSALVAVAAKRMEGGESTIGDGFNVAFSKIGIIFGYAAIAATVGVLLRSLEQRLGFVGQIVVGLLGVAWTAATFLVVPLLVHRDIGPVDAVKESAVLLKETWGENIIANAGMAVVFGLFYVPLGLVIGVSAIVVLFGMDSSVNSPDQWIAAYVLVAAVLLIVLLGIIHAALQGIYGAALYRYATNAGDDSGPSEFESNLLADAFAPK